MFNRPSSDQPLDPDQPMVGMCLVCRTVVACRRVDCRELRDPGMGMIVCAPCPKPVGKDQDGRTLTCGMRVHMSKKKQLK